MKTTLRLFILLAFATLAVPVLANDGTLTINCGIVCTVNISCGGHLQPTCSSGHACDGNNVAFTLPNPYVYTCPGFPCSTASITFTTGCYNPLDPPTCSECSGNGQYQCVPATGCGGLCDAGLTPDVNGFCRPCGSVGEPICEDGEPACEASLIIAGGECWDDCGGAGQGLCPNGECQDWHFDTGISICAACGGDPNVPGSIQSICPGDPACRPNVVQEVLVCFNCGQDQEPECDGIINPTCYDGAEEIGPNENNTRICAYCGGNNEVACEDIPCDAGMMHITDDNLYGDITDCLWDPQLTDGHRHFAQQNGFCSDNGPDPMTRTPPEAWPAEEDSSPGRNTVLLIHGRGASCGGSMANVLGAGGLYDAGHLTYCVQYAQENNGIDDRAVQILSVTDDVLGIPQPTCTATSCTFDGNNLVAEVIAPTPVGEVPSVAEVGIALRDAILQIPIEGELILIGHSQGGFIAREMVYSHYDELRWSGKKIGRVITLQHPYFTKHADPHTYTPWVCYRNEGFDCSTGRWTWGWDVNAPGTINDGDYPQIEWTVGSGAGALGAFAEDADGDGTDSTTRDWECLFNFGGVWADDVLYDTSVPIEGSLGYDEFGYFSPLAADLPFDRKYHGTGPHTASYLLAEMLDTPASCGLATGVGSPPDSCQGVDAGNGILPYSPEPVRTPDVLEFNGSTTRITIDDPGAIAALDMTTALTIDAWIYPTGPGSPGAGGIIVNKEGEYWLARRDDGIVTWALADGNWVARASTYIAPERVWTHLAFIYDGATNTARLYANGRLVQTWTGLGASLGDVNTAENGLDIGARAVGNQFFDGRIDDVRVWDAAFSDGEISTLVNGQPSGFPANPVVWYRFDTDGDTVFDQSGNAFDGSISTLGPAAAPIRQRARRLGKPGGALYLDGVDDRAMIRDPGAMARLDMDTEMTIEGWMYLRSHDFATMMVVNDGQYWLAASFNGQVGFAVANTSPGWVGVYSDYFLPLRTWTHVAWVYDAGAGTATLYINGQFEQEWTVSGSIGDADPGSNFLGLGGRNGAENIHGVIDEIRVWSVARSAAEIAQNYNRTLALPETEAGLAGYWDFDERYGEVVFDRSGSGNHALLGDGTPAFGGYRNMASHLPGYRLIYAGTCGNGFIEPMEDCDDGNGAGGDGCSAACRTETVFEVMGDAMGGSVSIDIAGVTVSVTTTAGQTADQVVAALAAAIQADATLASLGITASSAGDQVFIGAEFDNVVITDPGLMDCASTLPFPIIDGDVMNTCPEAGVVLSTSGPYTEYQWFYEGQPIEGATGATLMATLTGDYSVRVGDGSGCLRDSFSELTFVTFCPETEISPREAVFPFEIVKDPASPTGYYATFQNVDDVDGFHLYEGTLGTWYDHGAGGTCQLAECSVSNNIGCFGDLGNGQVRIAISPSAGEHYYLVTGYQGSDQGPAGTDSSGTPRDPAEETCLP